MYEIRSVAKNTDHFSEYKDETSVCRILFLLIFLYDFFFLVNMRLQMSPVVVREISYLSSFLIPGV